jgi:tRNA threonylcarbamoyladenosine dehydratase
MAADAAIFVNGGDFMRFQRFIALIGPEAFESIQAKTVLVAGLGGVGSYVFEALVRSGIKTLVIADHDCYDITNLNRQLGATQPTIGLAKVDVCEENAKAINPDIEIVKHRVFIDQTTIHSLFLRPIDFIVDAVDSIDAKLLLIQVAEELNIPIVCSMGFANKLHPEQILIKRLNQTSICPLAREVRRRCRAAGISSNPFVVYSEEPPIASQIPGVQLGSTSFTPSAAGLILASHVINTFLGGPSR